MKFLIVEDEVRVASLIQRGLAEQGFASDLAYDGVSGQKLALQQDYDLVITDVILPGMDGVTLCKVLRAARPELPIILLTALGTTDDKVEGFDAGADDYLVKPFDIRELFVRVRALLKRRGMAPQHAGVLQFADLEMNLHTREVRRAGRDIYLTPKEFRLLSYMLQHPGRVLSRVEIAEKVWDTYFDTGTNFIDVYINYLRKKMDKGFSGKLIHTHPGVGFMLKHEPCKSEPD